MKKCTATLLLIPLLFVTGCTSKTEEKAQEPIVYESVYTHNIAFLSSNGLTAEEQDNEVYLLTASVQPSNASDKSCTWSASWTTANGDDVYEYVDLCPLTDTTKCEVEFLKIFSDEIKITARTVEGGFTANVFARCENQSDESEDTSFFKKGKPYKLKEYPTYGEGYFPGESGWNYSSDITENWDYGVFLFSTDNFKVNNEAEEREGWWAFLTKDYNEGLPLTTKGSIVFIPYQSNIQPSENQTFGNTVIPMGFFVINNGLHPLSSLGDVSMTGSGYGDEWNRWAEGIFYTWR